MNNSNPIMGTYLDASTTVGLVLPPPASSELLERLDHNLPLLLLPVCQVAAISSLERHFRSHSPSSQDEFAEAVRCLTGELFKGTRLTLHSLPLGDMRQSRVEAEALAKKHNLEIIEAWQLYYLARALADDPLGTLVTVDEGFEQAADHEGLRVWNCLRDVFPPTATK